MKKILFLLLSTIAMYGQVPADATPLENIQITNNTQSTTATKVNVQENDGTINTISKSDLVNVVEVNDVPSLPLVGEVGKIYVVSNVNKIYRWNGTFYQELAVADISGLQAQIDLKAPISSVHNPVTLGTANGLSLATQQLSLGLASSGTTGALSGTDWNTFNNKVNGTGTNNFLTKWSGTNTINASGAWRETSNRLANAADNGVSEFQVTGQIDLKSKNTQGDGGQLGAELLTTGTGYASWTGTSFATGYTHSTGSVTTLTSALAPVINNLYQVAYTVTGRTAGSFNIAFGGATTAEITSSSAVGHIASTTGTLVITPTSDFNGTIILSIKQITAGTASFVFRDNSGTIRSELRILGNGNTANGLRALQNNTTGNGNAANGTGALQNNTTGNYNIANGVAALQNNTTGINNTANGESALRNNTIGNYNIANGASAGRLIANGSTPLTVANRSTFLGADTKALSDNSANETVVGHNAIGDGNNTVSIGNTSVVSSRLRGRLLQGGVVDNLIDSGQFGGNVLATGFKTASGTASQFLKANGSVDATVYAPLASPSLTGTPTAPTATVGTNTTQVATTAFVNNTSNLKEDLFNKQNSLSVDGSNTKYPTVTAVNHNLSLRANYGSNLIIDEALIDGYYIDVMGNGAVNTVEGYSITSFIEVSKTSYLLSDTYQQWAVYDSDFTFITGSFSDEGGGDVPPVPYKKEIDIPPSARYIRLTIRNIEKDAFYIARKNLYAKEFSIVAKKGGDFSTVQAAVNASFENQTIYIYPGVYEETVNTVGRKVKLIGFDKSSTKITTNGGSYYFPPLECSGGTYAENITFEATSYNPVAHTINAYAVHMDFEGEGVTEFNNCSLISHQNAGIGAGLHNNQTLKLNNCDIIKYSDGAVFNGGALYFHNSPFPNEQNQILEVTGCRIFTDNGKAIIIDDARHNAGGVDINTIMTFSNNRVYSLTDNYDCVTYSNTPIDGGVSGRIRLSSDSYGNSIDKLNKIKFLDNFANQSFNGTKQFNEPLISRGYYLFGNAGSAEWKLINDYNELNDFNIVRGSNVAFSINSSYQSKFISTVEATSYTATSLPVFENNAAASSLAVGQFYRTSIGVLMVKF